MEKRRLKQNKQKIGFGKPLFTESNRYTVGGEFMRIVKLLITILAKRIKFSFHGAI